eukprot:GHVH01004389.1.p1 GENE.GHVH01004389.1~~GHVH01004389.1.p1  ORF type:complete len:413 (+),score=56.50 GHVH01004389.1:74-1240(+)
MAVNDKNDQLLRALVPQDMTGEIAELFIQNLKTIPFDLVDKLTSDDPLTNDDIIQIGKAVKPVSKHTVVVNVIMKSVADAFRGLNEVRIKRFFAAGDYSTKTGVGIYRDSVMVAYVKKSGLSRDELNNYLYNFLETLYSNKKRCAAEWRERGLTPSDDEPMCSVSLSKKGVIVTLGITSVCLIVADSLDVSDFESVLDSLPEAYEMLLRHPNPSSSFNDLGPKFQETADRFVQSFPPSWIDFIRFVKFWSLLNLHGFLSLEAVEALAIKILINQDTSDDLVRCFDIFLMALFDPSMITTLDDVEIPPYEFSKKTLPTLKSITESVPWNKFTVFPSSSSVVLRPLLHATRNSVGYVTISEWSVSSMRFHVIASPMVDDSTNFVGGTTRI